MTISYKQVRADFEYLESKHLLQDTCQCFMDHVVDLMEEPTKAKAARMYESGIGVWFMETIGGCNERPKQSLKDARVKRIAKQYGYVLREG